MLTTVRKKKHLFNIWNRIQIKSINMGKKAKQGRGGGGTAADLLVDVHLVLGEGDGALVEAPRGQAGQLAALLQLRLGAAQHDAAHDRAQALLPAQALVVDPLLPHLERSLPL